MQALLAEHAWDWKAALAALQRFILATTPMSRAAHDLGYAWSRWRRRHQARARWHHYHARLKAAASPDPARRIKTPSCNKPGL